MCLQVSGKPNYCGIILFCCLKLLLSSYPSNIIDHFLPHVFILISWFLLGFFIVEVFLFFCCSFVIVAFLLSFHMFHQYLSLSPSFFAIFIHCASSVPSIISDFKSLFLTNDFLNSGESKPFLNRNSNFRHRSCVFDACDRTRLCQHTRH